MSNAYRTPGRDIDETEIERTKIQEAAATKRKLIEEREETKRKRVATNGPIPAILSSLVVVVGVIAAAVSYNAHIEAGHPKATEPCVEVVEVIGRMSDARYCRNGGHVETTNLPNGGDVLWRCVCGAAKDGGS